MSQQLTDATAIIARAKDAYQGKLAQADSLLEAAIANDPTEMSAARALQVTYATGFSTRKLSPSQQPPLTAFDFLQLTETVTAVLA